MNCVGVDSSHLLSGANKKETTLQKKKKKKEISFSSEDRAVLRGGYLHQFSSEIFVCFFNKRDIRTGRTTHPD